MITAEVLSVLADGINLMSMRFYTLLTQLEQAFEEIEALLNAVTLLVNGQRK